MEEKRRTWDSLCRAWFSALERVADAVTLAGLWLLDRLAGEEPPTAADVARERMRERLRRAFPGLDIDGAGAQRKRRDR